MSQELLDEAATSLMFTPLSSAGNCTHSLHMQAKHSATHLYKTPIIVTDI